MLYHLSYNTIGTAKILKKYKLPNFSSKLPIFAFGMTYVKVILPLMLDWLPTYSTTDALNRGDRVKVRFGARCYTGVVSETDCAPEIDPGRIQPVLGKVLEPVSEEELKLWEFCADYYMCSIGEIYKAAYPQLTIRTEEIGARKKAKAPATVREPGIRWAGPQTAPKPLVLRSADRLAVYEDEIRNTIGEGRDTLILAPDKAGLKLLQKALKPSFGDRLRVFSSGISAVARREIIDDLRDGEQSVVLLGTSLALFLPYGNLGTIIVEDEHSSLYKRQDPAPRINGRDLAVVLAGIHRSRILLGSPTPSLETIAALKSGKYLRDKRSSERHPTVEVIDMSAEKRKRGVRGLFSLKALDALREEKGKSLILRGWEKEEELDGNFRSASLYERQSEHCDLAVVLQADCLLGKDNFRADEQAWQTLAGIDADRIIIQTSRPEHPVLSALENGTDPDFDAMLSERKSADLPPFTRGLDLIVRDRNADRRNAVCDELLRRLCFLGEALRTERDDCSRLGFATARSSASVELKRRALRTVNRYLRESKYPGAVHFDVDPRDI